jgi:two-component system sensor histidine kinase KdpD
VEHLESVNDVAEDITGRRQPETIPDDIVRDADQVELVDMTPDALQARLADGDIYTPDQMDASIANSFRLGSLTAMRQLALLWVADHVDDAVRAHRSEHGVEERWETRERVVVALAGGPSGDALIRRAARMAQRSRADLLGVHVRRPDGRRGAASELLERHRELLEGLGGAYHEVVDVDVADSLARFARRENATQLVLGATRRNRWAQRAGGSVVTRVIRRSEPMDVHVMSVDCAPIETAHAAPAPRAPALTARRRVAGWAVSTGGSALLTVLFAQTRASLHQPSRFLLYEALVLVAAAIGGIGPAITAALAASAALNWFFTPPFYTWTIEDPENVLALVVFTAVGLLVAILVTGLARRSSDARRARTEAEALARVAAGLVGADDPLPPMLDRIRTTLGLAGVAIYASPGDTPLAVSGEPSLRTAHTVRLPDGAILRAGPLGPDDRRVIDAFAAQLATALERRRLREEAAAAAALAEADALRTSLLRAVSHDLRTPLASIKASVTSLLQADVDWSPREHKEFLLTVDEETDRLDHVVANLLDASRLQAGAVEPADRPVALDEALAPALASISGLTTPIDIDVPETVPLVRADPGLVERAVANLVANAARLSPPGERVRMTAETVGDRVELRIIDRGPGVPVGGRDRMFEPFQRLGDNATTTGVGLGLAVSKGLIDAMGGLLEAQDTPGGGLTMVVSLPRAYAG